MNPAHRDKRAGWEKALIYSIIIHGILFLYFVLDRSFKNHERARTMPDQGNLEELELVYMPGYQDTGTRDNTLSRGDGNPDDGNPDSEDTITGSQNNKTHPLFRFTKQFLSQEADKRACLVENLNKTGLHKSITQAQELSFQTRCKKHAVESWHRYIAQNRGRFRGLDIKRAASFTFAINRTGDIARFEIIKSSGNHQFDQIIRDFLYTEATPFPAIPGYITDQEFTPNMNCTFYVG